MLGLLYALHDSALLQAYPHFILNSHHRAGTGINPILYLGGTWSLEVTLASGGE